MIRASEFSPKVTQVIQLLEEKNLKRITRFAEHQFHILEPTFAQTNLASLYDPNRCISASSFLESMGACRARPDSHLLGVFHSQLPGDLVWDQIVLGL